ncbi:MAG: glutamate mutase L [Burkholderiaceae bacterium]
MVAGNREAADEVAQSLAAAGKLALVTDNVMPELNVLSIEPARKAIRELFMARIVTAKGIDRAQAKFDRVLMPTQPVLEGAAARRRRRRERGLGDLMVIDPGGATTDVHSIGKGGISGTQRAAVRASRPCAKRTVEGDLGMRHNALTIVEGRGARSRSPATPVSALRARANWSKAALR